MDYLALYERHLGSFVSRSGYHYRFRCPECDPRKDPSFAMNAQSGLYICYRCGIAGNARQFARRYNEAFVDDGAPAHLTPDDCPFDQETATKVYTELHRRMTYLSDECYQNLCIRRGIENPYGMGLRTINGEPNVLLSVFSETDLVLSGLFYMKDGILLRRRVISDGRLWIPYYVGSDNVNYIRTRGDSKPKYLGPKGGSCKDKLWISPRMNDTDYVIVTEGELKAISAASHGIPCIAMPGMNSARNEVLTQVKQRGVRDVIICFDTQAENAKDVIAARKSLSRVLISGGCHVLHMNLPLLPSVSGGSKMDIDSFIATAGVGMFREMIEDVRGTNGQKHQAGSPAEEGRS